MDSHSHSRFILLISISFAIFCCEIPQLTLFPNRQFLAIDDWEQRKLGDLVTSVVREIEKPNQPYKRLSIRSHAKGTFQQKVDDPTTVLMDKLYIVKENDLVINITFAWEHAIAIATKSDDGLLVSHRFPTFLINKSDINFIHYSVSQESFRRKMEFISPGGAGRNRVLNKKDFLKLKLETPKNITEQTKIGNFFKLLDDTIALHQEKLEALKRIKTAYLDKIFSQEIRFSGFEETWEQRKLGEISSNFRSGGTITSKEIFDCGKYPVYGGNGLRGYTETYTHEGVYVLIGRQGALCGNINTVSGKVYISEHAIAIAENEMSDIRWLEQLLIKLNLNAYSESSAQPGLSVDKLKKLRVFSPSKKEQIAIGNLFCMLDDTITLHHQKIDSLHKLKCAYLQKMFL